MMLSGLNSQLPPMRKTQEPKRIIIIVNNFSLFLPAARGRAGKQKFEWIGLY